MAGRYDKYDPISGGFRAPLDADWAADLILGVGLNSTGEVVVGAGQTGIIGVVATTKAMKAGDIIDVMTSGECVECTGLAAGTIICADTTSGVLNDVASSTTQVPVGYTVEASRLIVRKGVRTHDLDVS